jgi:hypothetical protein
MIANVRLVFVLCLAGANAWGQSIETQAIEYNRDIRPILSDRCFACHGPDGGNRKAGLRLDVEAAAKGSLPSKRIAIVAGAPEKSELIRRVSIDHKTLRMPPAYAGHNPLSAAEVALLTKWVVEGARYQQHWSFLPPRREAGKNIDTFIRERLAREGLRMSPEAERSTLLRRVALDLTGLPPTAAEVEAFVKDASPNAYEKVVDRLLRSPRYAERMAIRWLEAARYADTNGYQSDGERDMWRWRDWVIEAFRKNMPFDRFTIEQIAGDLLPGATREQKIATGFHRNHRTNAEGGIVEEEFRVEYVADRVETTSTVWLGLTVGCARCHDHKYDPIRQKDFYSLFAFYNNVPERGLVYNFGNEEPFLQAPLPEQEKQLAKLDSQAKSAEQRWNALQPKIAKAQRDWEKRIAKGPVREWSVKEGLVLQKAIEPAYRFDGERFLDEGQQVAKFDYKDPFTLAAWIKPEAATGAIMSRTEEWLEGEGYGLYLMDGKLRLHITRRWTDISLRIETVNSLPLNRWQHVAVSYDGRRKGKGVRMYVDGQPQELKILFDELTYPLGPKEPFRIGAGGGPQYRFRGQIDDVRVYNRALREEEAVTLALKESVDALARVPVLKRTPAQESKLRLCFLETDGPDEFRATRKAMFEAQVQRQRYSDSIPTVMVMVEGAPRDAFVLKRGTYDAPGEKVEAAVPSFLPQLPEEAPRNRLSLAKWLVSRDNPLTARVTVNRLWQMLFGTGLVKTVEDFGSQGEWPVHAELLDWLAVEFMDSGWDVRHLLKTIVMSDTYRQSSRVTPELLQKDPENRLLARGPRIRLSAEMIRDQALAFSGLLVEQVGGPSVKPHQPAGLWQELAGGKGYEADKGPGLYRRSLYTYWKRTVAPPNMILFDSPTRESCNVREVRTNTPLQALNLMNDPTYVEAAARLAERMKNEGGSTPSERIRFGYRTVVAREPREPELQLMLKTLDRFRGDMQPIASLLLNLDEAITKE